MKKLVSDFTGAIQHISENHCVGCLENYSSFKNHTCYIYDWNWEVAIYFDETLVYLKLKKENIDIDYLRQLVEESNGTSYDC
jgi:hypothetical protein